MSKKEHVSEALTVNESSPVVNDQVPGTWDGVQKPPAHMPDFVGDEDAQSVNPTPEVVDTTSEPSTAQFTTKGEARVQGRPANGAVCTVKTCGAIVRPFPADGKCPRCGSTKLQSSRVGKNADGTFRVTPA